MRRGIADSFAYGHFLEGDLAGLIGPGIPIDQGAFHRTSRSVLVVMASYRILGHGRDMFPAFLIAPTKADPLVSGQCSVQRHEDPAVDY